MTKLKYIMLVVIGGFLIASSVDAQQLTRRSQFMFNPYQINPAVAGTKNHSPIFASYRNQWTGFDGAPETYTLSGHTSLRHGIGAGFIAFNDVTGGAISRTGVEFTGSYKVDLTQEDQISFGLSPVFGQYKFNNDSLVYYDPNDIALQGGMESDFIFDAGFGMLVFGPNYMFGFSIPNIFQSRLDIENNETENQENQFIRHYYLMGSYNYYVSDMVALQPSLLTKFTAVTPVQFDLNVKVSYDDFIWSGLSYRHQDAVAVMIGGEYENFMLGYAYDITITDARNFSPHTHEITVGYQIQRNPKFRGRGGGTGKVIRRRR